ncbi:MAG: hypothetical protein D8M57_05785 [Candidatus Scalindua sp. AMX11]|nr:MAG: hypothetical protein DWQ00_12735 [Candidatus Scalindua sp.]NOG82850.1 hypothetical protein [Planctomycetota bacterium]RZV86196.1 MAG: hypothetical protein EX341_07455 [Candidatus Scalindua sp. SCAELEC01]TDE65816.1 MAG: hypothetical protein D8M57_05785 [Candidatus Scalindua sp. AMX11]GJQ58321.1 MAG: hypothetical protein SCALA701_11220 [Candidatus Scalindua sp.]
MTIIAGIDEAGYGPKIGPLVLTSVVMELPSRYDHETNLWPLLKNAISDKVQNRRNRIVVNDSKKTYSQRSGLRLLEETVLSFLWSKRERVTSFSDLLKLLSNHDSDVLDTYPWYKGKDITLPVASNISRILQCAEMITHSANLQNIFLRDVKSIFLCVREFNRQIEYTRNKAILLFNNSLQHLKEIIYHFGEKDTKVLIDKLGGRNYYHQLLTTGFKHHEVNTLSEGRCISTYTIGNEKERMNVSFIEGADSKYFPTALASMFSKYIRELFIRLFNTYWQEQINDLKPTAGYPEDAKRFLSQIDQTRHRLGIADDILIRIR